MARGNCKSMNKEIAGKIRSAVNGREEVMAVVVNELNATNRGMPVHNAILHDYLYVSGPKNLCSTSLELTVRIPIFFSILNS
jgi:hypothetical protein